MCTACKVIWTNFRISKPSFLTTPLLRLKLLVIRYTSFAAVSC